MFFFVFLMKNVWGKNFAIFQINILHRNVFAELRSESLIAGDDLSLRTINIISPRYLTLTTWRLFSSGSPEFFYYFFFIIYYSPLKQGRTRFAALSIFFTPYIYIIDPALSADPRRRKKCKYPVSKCVPVRPPKTPGEMSAMPSGKLYTRVP